MKVVRSLAGLGLVIIALLVFAVSVPARLPPSGVGAIGSSGTAASDSPVATPSIQPQLSNLPLPLAPVLGGCGEFITEGLRYAYYNTVGGLSEISDAVVTGTVIAISEARWATASGNPPSQLDGPPDAFQVYRVVEVQVTGVGKERAGEPPVKNGASIKVRVVGGTIGCQTFRLSDDLSFVVGNEVALFLAAGGRPALAAAPTEDFDAIDVWPIKNGTVEGRDVPMSPDELLLRSTGTAP